MMNGHGSVTMPIDGPNGPVITQLSLLGSFWLNLTLARVLARILGRIFTKLDMMNGLGSVTMPIEGLHGTVITAVMFG